MKYTVEARVTPQVFQSFAWFDLLRRQKRWRAPCLFALIMAVFAGACFALGGGLLGGVLLGVGLVLPLGWLLSFHLSVRAESKRLKLAESPVAYTLRLSEETLRATTPKETAEYPWEKLYRACRLKRCICLYATSSNAFLLPTDGAEGDRLWDFIRTRLPAERVRDYRRG